MQPETTNLGDFIRNALVEREDDFRKFYHKTVRSDPILNKMWTFCFEKDLLSKDPNEFYKSRLKLIKKGHISKSDFFHINNIETSADYESRIFYDAIRLSTYINAKVTIHKWRAEKAGYNIPINDLINAHSVFYREETEDQIKEVNYFSLPDFIEEYTRKSDNFDTVHEDICLICLLPPINKKLFIQFLRNYFENYTVELLQKSHHSRDISFGNASFVRLQDFEKVYKKEYSTHRYSISIELNGKRQKLIDCSLGEKYKPLIKKQSRRISNFLESLCDYGLADDRVRWYEGRQEIEIKFFELLLEYNPDEHGFLAGYLKQRLEYFCGHLSDHLYAKKRDPRNGFFKDAVIDSEDGKEIEQIGDTYNIDSEELQTINFPFQSKPDELLEHKQDYNNFEKIYQKFVEELPPKTKQFLKVWHKNPDYSGKELAEQMGISEAMVKKHKYYIRKKAPRHRNPFKLT